MDEKFRTLKATFLKCPNLGSLWGSCEFVAPLWWSTWGGGGVRTQDLLACAWYQKGITWKLGNFGFKDLRGERRLRYVFLLPPCVSMWNCMNWVSRPAPKSSFGEQPSSTSHYIVGQLVWKKKTPLGGCQGIRQPLRWLWSPNPCPLVFTPCIILLPWIWAGHMTCFRQMEYSKDDKKSFWYWIIKIVWLYPPPPHLHSSLPPPPPSFFPPSLTLFLSLCVSLSLSLFLSLHYEKVYMSRHSYQSAENWDLLSVRLENRPSILSQGMRWPVFASIIFVVVVLATLCG